MDTDARKYSEENRKARQRFGLRQPLAVLPSFRSLVSFSVTLKNMKTRPLLIASFLMPFASLTLLLSHCLAGANPATRQSPNIVYVLCDDLGYGDVHCFGGERSKIATPNIDRLASQGMAFRDAHSSSAVCTPTRYGILTGRYNWRSPLQSGVLFGYGLPLIAADRLTVPKLLKQHGYATACIGKWHLGMNIGKGPGQLAVSDGPTTRGFDYYFGISASLDMPPYAFIENERFTESLTAVKEIFKGRPGPAAPSFEAVDVLPTLTRKAVDYIGKATSPFFLYLPLNSPHTPIAPSKEWEGKSGLGIYGDFVMETDWALGEVMAALEKSGLAGNTLLIFTSDNGCSPAAGVKKLEQQGHYPSADRRGYKADIFDGGHRIPFIARWPGRIQAGVTNDQLICLNDLMATCADIVGATLPDNAGEDSVSLLPAFQGRTAPRVVVHHSINGSFAIRDGQWKLELCADSGGWSAPKPGTKEARDLPPIQLYDLNRDIGERVNEYQQHPDVVERLTRKLEACIANGRSTPGTPQTNDVAVEIFKTANKRNPAKK